MWIWQASAFTDLFRILTRKGQGSAYTRFALHGWPGLALASRQRRQPARPCSRAEQASRLSYVSWCLGLHERHNTSLHLSRRGECAWSRVAAACEDPALTTRKRPGRTAPELILDEHFHEICQAVSWPGHFLKSSLQHKPPLRRTPSKVRKPSFPQAILVCVGSLEKP